MSTEYLTIVSSLSAQRIIPIVGLSSFARFKSSNIRTYISIFIGFKNKLKSTLQDPHVNQLKEEQSTEKKPISKEIFETTQPDDTVNSVDTIKSTESTTLADLNKSYKKLTDNSSSLEKFIAKHKEIYKEDIGSFSLLRDTKVDGTWTLSNCVQHAQKHDNRSRKAFVELGWMNQDGSLKIDAPQDVRAASKPVEVINFSGLSSSVNLINQVVDQCHKAFDQLANKVGLANNVDQTNNADQTISEFKK